MLNRSFVLFKTLAEDKPPVADREYLVAIKDEDGEASFKKKSSRLTTSSN